MLLAAVLACCGLAQEGKASSQESGNDGSCWNPCVWRRDEATPAWRSWWAIERSRFEWVQMGTICGIYSPDHRVESDPDSQIRLPPGGTDRTSAFQALLGLLDRESDPEVLGSALISLAKNGEDSAKLVARLVPFLSRSEDELREAAVVAFAVLVDECGLPVLADLVKDTQKGRELSGGKRVADRMRALAAYGLARIGALSFSSDTWQAASQTLRTTLNGTSDPDLETACVHALGLVPVVEGTENERFELLLAFAADAERSAFARGQATLALVRGVAGLDCEHAQSCKERVGKPLLGWTSSKFPAALRRQAILAVGRLASTGGESELVERIRAGLRDVATREVEPVLAGYALLALAGTASALLPSEQERASALASFLIARAESAGALRPWALLACGRMAWELRNPVNEPARFPETLAALRTVIRTHVRMASPDQEASVIAANLAADAESYAWTIGALSGAKLDPLGCELASFLGSVPRSWVDPEPRDLNGAKKALRAFMGRAVQHQSAYREAARARERLDDFTLTSQLLSELASSTNLARASVLDALGTSEDARSVKPLLAVALDGSLVPRMRACAVAALGELLDKELRPWNSRFARDLDPLDAPPTLSHPGGSGILDYR